MSVCFEVWSYCSRKSLYFLLQKGNSVCILLILCGIGYCVFVNENILNCLFICLFVCRYRQDLGTTMSFLPSSQETTLYSPRATLLYSTNWPRASTSAQSARFVIQSLISALAFDFVTLRWIIPVLTKKWKSDLLFVFQFQIQAIDYSGDVVKVTSSNGSQWTAQKVNAW